MVTQLLRPKTGRDLSHSDEEDSKKLKYGLDLSTGGMGVLGLLSPSLGCQPLFHLCEMR